MATLVSPGASVTVINDSYYIAATSPTIPLIFLATRADKKQTDGISNATGALEHSIVRTITSLNQSISTYGIPYFRTDNSGLALHGDARNEYGLFALNQALTILSKAYIVRANIDLADAAVTTYSPDTPIRVGTGNGTLSTPIINQVGGVNELWTLTATATPTVFNVTGSVTGPTGTASVGVLYNNGKVSFTLTQGSTLFVAGDAFTFNVISSTVANPLGANDAAKRATIVAALNNEINSNPDVRAETFEYNLILCPGYYETVGSMLNLNLSINEEAFVVADTPMTNTPEATATWAGTVARQSSQNVGYYYPHGLAANLDSNLVAVAASGTALKTIAYSDNAAGVHFPPAGTRRGVVSGLNSCGYVSGTLGTATTFVPTPLNQGQRDILYQAPANINIIPTIVGTGIVVFGQKTSVGNLTSSLDRINAIRLIMKIKRDLRKISMSYLFELNDRITQDSIKQAFDNYLHDILVNRGLYDYVTICNSTNNTPQRIASNELYIDIALKIEASVEFIYIPLRVVSNGGTL